MEYYNKYIKDNTNSKILFISSKKQFIVFQLWYVRFNDKYKKYNGIE